MGPSDSALTREKRKNKRFKVRHEGMFGRLGEDHLVDIIDLSVGGVAMKTGSRLVIGREYFVRLHDRRKSLDVRGTVVRSRIVETRKVLFGQRKPVYASAMRLQEGLEDQVVDFICDTLLMSG
jgi:hypothetical protein